MLGRLRADLERAGVVLPDQPVTNARWHEVRGGWYFMLPKRHIAFYRSIGGDLQFWRADDRVLTPDVQSIILFAAASCPRTHSRCINVVKLPALQPAPVDPALGAGKARHAVALNKARALLEALFEQGVHSVVDIRAAAEEHGVKRGTLERAADALPVCSLRQGYGKGGEWLWVRANTRSL